MEEIAFRKKAIHSISNKWRQWEMMGAKKEIVGLLKDGVPIMVSKYFIPYYGRVDISLWSKEEREFLTEEICMMLSIGALEFFQGTPKVVAKYRLVPKKGKKKFRLIVDLRP
ncbi:hypothetical protein C9374_014735 [Naegleria lovaniensis]|nr:uncharacterized protein C9374_014735 [Naegleria lovaniensis]KAG2370615.1 hypothetical protein C9374_014735 [Naegleria lovaniensis]